MAGTTSVPSIVFTPTGLTLPADSDILAGVQADMNAAFGGGLNQSLSTPQGQLATSQSAILSAKNAEFGYFVNQIDPDNAGGFMQDAIARIYFLTRRPATSTVVQVDCLGQVGVVIPVGALVRDNNSNTYSCTTAGTIPSTGIITLPFAAVQTGPIACPVGAIAGAPYRAIAGWDRGYNSSAGVPGAVVESRADFEYRRRQSVALNGAGTLAAIYANVFAVSGVLDVYVAENTTNNTITLGSSGYSLLPHSIYVAAVGGASSDIGLAIWKRKDAGADYNGNTSVTVVDPSGYSYPQPSYTVKYQVPASTPISFAVQLANNAALPSNIVTLVQNAIINAFAGGDGGQRARIGSTIYASRYYAPVLAVAPGISILSMTIGSGSATQSSITMGIDQAPTVSASNISVTLV